MKRLITLLQVALAIFAVSSCDKTPEGGKLTFTINNAVIEANGTDAAYIVVKSGSRDVTSEAEIYDAETDTKLSLQGGVFTTDTPGTYSFYAVYNDVKTSSKAVTALSFPVPQLPADPSVGSSVFKKRMMIVQFTSTGCTFCPQMTSILRSLVGDAAYADKVVLASAHGNMYGYPNGEDPAIFSDINDLMGGFGINYFPALVLNLEREQGLSNGFSVTTLKRFVDFYVNDLEPSAGICAASQLDGNTLVVRVGVKAAVTTDLRLGCWLLEDGIYGTQTSAPDASYNTHDHCVRIADSRVAENSTNFIGHSIGKVEKGDTVEYVFVLNLDPSWNKENCRLMLFTSTPKTTQDYNIDTVVTMPLVGELEFEYV